MNTPRPVRCLLVIALIFAGVVFHREGSSQTKPIKKPGGSIAGRITLNGKGKSGILVSISNAENGAQRGPLLKATSGADGNYRIGDVPAGFYRVLPVAPDYVIPEVNLSSFGGRGKTLNLAEGEMVDDVDFSIIRGAVITGKVSYADGRPVIEEQVVATSVRQVETGGQVFQQGVAFQTDDRGVYRIYGLPAGQYKVSVGQSVEGLYGTVSRGRPALERVFHPDVSDTNEAKVIELSEGGEATNIDIKVGKTLQGFTANGLIIDGETNQPVPAVRFGLQRIRGEQRSFVNTTAISNQRGEFRIENILPGMYYVSILPQPNYQVQAEPVGFEVVDQDVSGLTLRTTKGASVAGSVVIEGTADKTVLARLSQLRLQVYVWREGNPGGSVQRSFIGRDGSFRVGGLQEGIASFSLSSEDFSQPKGFSFARAEREGVAQTRGLKLETGEQLSGVKVVFTYANGVVRGKVNIVNGPLPLGARVMVRLAKTGETNSSLRPQETDSRGYFVIEGVPAGSYDVFVSSFIPNSRQRPPWAKQTITVGDGEATEVNLTLDLNPSRDPNSAP
jgi:uncharacterized GH25 family protein